MSSSCLPLIGCSPATSKAPAPPCAPNFGERELHAEKPTLPTPLQTLTIYHPTSCLPCHSSHTQSAALPSPCPSSPLNSLPSSLISSHPCHPFRLLFSPVILPNFAPSAINCSYDDPEESSSTHVRPPKEGPLRPQFRHQARCHPILASSCCCRLCQHYPPAQVDGWVLQLGHLVGCLAKSIALDLKTPCQTPVAPARRSLQNVRSGSGSCCALPRQERSPLGYRNNFV